MSPCSAAMPTCRCRAPSAATMMRPASDRKCRVRGQFPPRTRAELAVFEEAHRDRLVDALRDDSTAEAGEPADVGTGRCLAVAHEVHDAQEAGDLVGLRAEAECRAGCHAAF